MGFYYKYTTPLIARGLRYRIHHLLIRDSTSQHEPPCTWRMMACSDMLSNVGQTSRRILGPSALHCPLLKPPDNLRFLSSSLGARGVYFGNFTVNNWKMSGLMALGMRRDVFWLIFMLPNLAKHKRLVSWLLVGFPTNQTEWVLAFMVQWLFVLLERYCWILWFLLQYKGIIYY